MFPLLGALAGVGGSIGSALIGSNAAHSQQVTNYMIALMNHQAQEEQQFYQRGMADKLMHKQDQGTTDAMGNATRYVPGKGWVTTLSDTGQGLQNAQVAEQGRQFADLQDKRRLMESNLGRQAGDADRADAYLNESRHQRYVNPTELYYSMLKDTAQGINEGYDKTEHGVATQALRSNTSNTGPIFAELARARGKDLSGAMTQAKSSAMTLAPQLNNEAVTNDNNLYNMFATRAGNMPDVSFTPPNVSQSAGAEGKAAMDNANLGLSFVNSAASAKAPQFPYMPADYSGANAFGAVGTSIGSAINNYNQQQQFGEILRGLRNQGTFAS